MRQIVLLMMALAFLAVGCGPSAPRVTVPGSPGADAAPKITITALPVMPAGGGGALGDIEQSGVVVTAPATVHVSRGASIKLVANATNPGGVQSFSLTIAQAGATLMTATTSGTKDAAGTAPSTLVLAARDGSGEELIFAAPSDVTVTAHATSFNGQARDVAVTYTPADLTITLVANPPVIGYHLPSSSTLTWSVLYGVPPVAITMDGVPGPAQAIGSLVVSPTVDRTPFTIRATDRTRSDSKTVWIAVVAPPPPPPPPSVALDLSPQGGRNCLGVEDTVSWNVTSCPAPCNISLTGVGRGYAASFKLGLANLRPSGTFKITPPDQIDLTLTATSPAGSAQSAKSLLIVSPVDAVGHPTGACGSTPPVHPTVSIAYFAIEASDPSQVRCSWYMVGYGTGSESDVLAQVQALYGPTYHVTSISADDFANHRKCPRDPPPAPTPPPSP